MVLCAISITIGSLLASALVIVGGASRSCGNRLVAWETLSRTSLAAFSRSASSSNSTVILLDPIADDDDIDFTPSIPLIERSSTSVICDSMISAFAPVYDVETVIIEVYCRI